MRSCLLVTVSALLTALLIGLLCHLMWRFFWAGFWWTLLVAIVLVTLSNLVYWLDDQVALWRRARNP